MELKSIEAGVLEIAYLDDGPKDGWPCIMGHGFPYDVNAYEHVTPILADAGARVIVPYLRGYGPTRFLSTDTPRSGEQAALGADLLALMDALKSTEPLSADMIGAGGRRVLFPPYGRNALSHWYQGIHTIFKTLQMPWCPSRPPKKHPFGTNIIFTPNGDAKA